MLLVIDIGNTNIVLGVFSEPTQKMSISGKLIRKYLSKGLINHWRISTGKFKTADEYGPEILELFHYASVDPSWVTNIIISSVVPFLISTFEDLCKKYFNINPFIFRLTTESGIPILYDNPKEVGTDRVANAFAAFNLYKRPAIIVDFGTATTFDVVTAKGEYAGGVIVPGIGISADALFKTASKLPYVEIAKPDKILGKNTIESIQAGLIYGVVGQVEYIIKELKKRIKGKTLVIATGGFANLISKEVKSIKIINPTLTLEGLALIYWKKYLKKILDKK